ncbi:anti-sigma factor [Actinopolyspora mortivallis]|uniref:anti-sigma factor n=1 Tax=Actinopolyspora mortivallis TaxID=33906 RepID=UPI00037A33DE|nr:anti-sigma factor [Actinopolyspora mortivallis]
MSTTEMSTLTGAYALDALTGTERARFERHLAVCEDCTREVRELRETVARLGTDAAASPPEGLKERVLEEVARTRQRPPRTGGRGGRGAPSFLPPHPWTTRLAVAAAVVGIVLAGVFGGVAWHTQRQLAEVTRQDERIDRVETATRVMRLLSAPDARVVRSSEGKNRAAVVVSEQRGGVAFLGSDMAEPPPNRVYQLWFLDEGRPVSAGVFEPAAGMAESSVVSQPPEGADHMAVTVEPEGGSARPSTEPVMVLDMPV